MMVRGLGCKVSSQHASRQGWNSKCGWRRPTPPSCPAAPSPARVSDALHKEKQSRSCGWVTKYPRTYRGTSLIRNRDPLGPYGKAMLKAPWGP